MAFALPALCPEQRGDDDDGSGLFRFRTTSFFDLVYKGARGLGICRTMGRAGRVFVDVRPRSQGEMGRLECSLEVIQGSGETRRGAMRNRIKMSCAPCVVLSADPAVRHWLLAHFRLRDTRARSLV